MHQKILPKSILDIKASRTPEEQIILHDCSLFTTMVQTRISCLIRLSDYSEEAKEIFRQSMESGGKISLMLPLKTVWKYPEWVWWEPKQENEKYYRFLNIGKEEIIQEKMEMENGVVKVINLEQGFAEIEIYPQDSDSYFTTPFCMT